ncbi:MAG: TlpA family protein disulfide reductase [Proteobacteria bacterium]|nr:TlpA family protein disulfide reductase [Pseudomonadota bacterium]
MRGVARRIAAVALLALGCGGESDPAASSAAPDFTLPRLGGGEVALAELRGRPVVIDFWATWCAPCVHQIPVLNDFQERMGDKVVVLGVAVDARGAEVVEPFASEHGIAYSVLLGDEALAREYGAFGFPSLYVLGPDGHIEAAHVGIVSADELDRAVAVWVAGPDA